MSNTFNNETEFVFSSEFTGFTVIPNHIMNNRSISYKALGIYCQILQYQNAPGHKIYIKSLQAYKKDGKESIASGLNELVKAGYITKEQLRDSNGKMAGVKYTVYANPCKSSSLTDNGKPDFGKSDNGKPGTYKENTNKNKTTKKESSSNSAPAAALENFYFDCFDQKPVQTVKTKINEYLKVMDADCIKLAMEKSVGHSWGYCLAILKAWAELGVKTLSDVELKDSKANTKQQQQNAPQGELVSKNPQFTRTYSHNWDLDALDELASGDLDRQLEKWNGLDVAKDDEGYDQIKFK